MNKSCYSSFFILLFIFLTACTGRYSYPVPDPRTQGEMIGLAGGAVIGSASGVGAGTVVGGAVGGLVGGVIGDSIQRHQSLKEQITMHGIQIIEVGDKVKMVIPVDHFFYDDSPRLNPHYYPVLNKVAMYIRDFPKTSVRVSAFTDNTGCEARNLALTREQARSMASYLWRQKIDARIIYPVGYGSNCPISHNQTSQGRAENRRIEITFWRITPDDDIA